MSFKRPSGRQADQLRPITIEPHISKNAYGSCMISFGDTKILCTASLETEIPRFLRNSGQGWVTAEYGMLPGSTNTRIKREATTGRQGGRTMEIQRLIGRSLRSVTNLKLLGEHTLTIDCDVLQADGGTRTASITGGYVALYLACQRMLREGRIRQFPLTSSVAAVSCGIYENVPVVDLDYAEDSNAEVDANFVLTADHQIIEIQGTAEQQPFSQHQLISMLELAKEAVTQLTAAQNAVLSL